LRQDLEYQERDSSRRHNATIEEAKMKANAYEKVAHINADAMRYTADTNFDINRMNKMEEIEEIEEERRNMYALFDFEN